MIISLDNLLKEIAAEPMEDNLSAREKRFVNEVEYLKKEDIEMYVHYWTEYLKIRNKTLDGCI